MNNAQKARIISELEQMLGNQILECKEVDAAADEVFNKFIEPLIHLNELLKVDPEKTIDSIENPKPKVEKVIHSSFYGFMEWFCTGPYSGDIVLERIKKESFLLAGRIKELDKG